MGLISRVSSRTYRENMSHPEVCCKHCGSCVLKAKTGTLLENYEDTLPTKSDKNDTETFKSWIEVADIFDFYNVGFSKTVNTDLKYLICADCERGPIGVQYISKKKILIAVDTLKSI